MNEKYDFFIAGKTRNKDNILKICDIFDKYDISYYCFLKNDETMNSYGEKEQNEEEKMKAFESLGLKSEIVLNIFKQDLDNEKACKNFLLVLPAGRTNNKFLHAFSLSKSCLNIFKTISLFKPRFSNTFIFSSSVWPSSP